MPEGDFDLDEELRASAARKVEENKRRIDERSRALVALAFGSVEERAVEATHIKELTDKHKTVLALFAMGKGPKEIAGLVGFSIARVQQVCKSDAGAAYLREFFAKNEFEIEQLQSLAFDAVRAGLTHGDTEMRLKAVDRFTKLPGVSGPREGEGGNIYNDHRTMILQKIKIFTETESANSRGPTPAAPEIVDEHPRVIDGGEASRVRSDADGSGGGAS